MAHILILGGGAAGLAAALAAAQTDPTARVTVLERSPRPGKKLLATGNGRCKLDNEGITPESYSSADRAALDALLRTVNAADPLGWFRALGLYTRTRFEFWQGRESRLHDRFQYTLHEEKSASGLSCPNSEKTTIFFIGLKIA